MGKAKRHGWLRNARLALETLLLRTLFGVLGRVPPRWHGPLAGALAAFSSVVFPIRSKVLTENLDIAFPPEGRQPAPGTRQIMRETVLFALELARLNRASEREVTAGVRIDEADRDRLAELTGSGRGLIIASAHLGNWEWLGAWYALTQGNIGVVYKPMHNPQADRIAVALRERFGTKIFSTRERTPRAMFNHLRAGGAVAILADQDARRQGRFLDFFGRPASTAFGLAAIAVRLNVPILPGFCLREGPCRFRVVSYPPLWPDPAADREAEEERLMRAYLACVEDVIRRAPEQYFWWHRRWKTKPDANRVSERVG